MLRVNFGLMYLLSLTFVGSAFAQTADDTESSSPGVATLRTTDPFDSTSTNTGYSGGATLGSQSYLNARHMTGPGVGYDGSYSQVGAFIPLWMGENSLIAPDLRLNLTNSSQFGGNFGLVGRQYIESWDRLVGAYGYYDFDQSGSNHVYNQGTIGAETLGNWLDVRANGYFPTGTTDNYTSQGPGVCVSGNPYFSGNSIVFNGVQGQNREVAATGGDFEIGMPLGRTTPWLRGYVGAYFYHANQQAPVSSDDPIPGMKTKNPVGFRARVDAWLTEDLLTGVNVTTDPVWGTNVNAVIDFRFNGFKATRYFPQWTTRQRMLNSVQRNWRIAVEKYGTAVNTSVAAVDPNTGKPYFVEFINSAAAPGGNGSYEHPFSYTNLSNFQNNPNINLILVDKGTSTVANPYTGSISLFNNQQLLGQGAANVAPIPLSATYGDCSVTGNFTLPGLDGSGQYPFVSNSGSNAIFTLGNNNQVAGFNLINSGGAGIVGNGITNFNLHDLEISNNAGPGIALSNVTGATTIISNINTGVADNLNPKGLGDNKGGGIFVSSGTGGISNLQLTNVNMNSSTPGTQPYGINLVATKGPLTFTETNVNTNFNVTGQLLQETNQALIGTLNNVTANGNTADGIDMFGVGGSMNISSTTPSTPLVTNNNGGTGVVFSLVGGTGQLNLTGAQSNANKIDGIGLYGSNQSNTTVNIVNSQYIGNTRDGIHQDLSTGATQTVNVDPTLIENNGRNGVYFSATGKSNLVDTFTNDTITANGTVNPGGSAIFGSMNGSKANVTVNGTTATGSSLYGFHVDATNSSVFTGTIGATDFSNSHSNGFDISVSGKSTATFGLTNTLVNLSGQNAVNFLADTGSTLNFNSSSGQFNNSQVNGITGVSQNQSNVNLNFSGAKSSISGNMNNGVFVTATTGANVAGTFDSTAINMNKSAGVLYSLSNSPNSSLTMTGMTTVNDNGSNGIEVDAAQTSQFTPTLTGTVIERNGGNGVLFNDNSGSIFPSGSFTGVMIADNKVNGLQTNVDGLGSAVTLTLSNTQITNTSGTAPQLIGFDFSATNGGQLTAGFIKGSSLDNNGQNAVFGTVIGTGNTGSSSASILLDGTNASGSGSNNAQLAVSLGGLLQFTGQNGASLSNSLNGAGIVATVSDVNSVAYVDLNSALVNSNKTSGFIATVTDSNGPGAGQQGAALNADLEGSSFSFNQHQGISITASGQGASANFGAGVIGGTPDTVNNNGYDGVLGVATNLAAINFRSISSTFDNNGTSAPAPSQFDGLNFQTDNAAMRVLLFGGEAKGNTGDGVSVGPVTPTSTSNSMIVLSLANGFTSSGNGADSLNFDANGANTAYLLTDINSNPVLQGPINLDFTGVSNAVASLTGSFHFDNLATNGLTANFSGAQTAVFYLNGLGTSTANGNQASGLDVTMSNVTNGSILIEGFSSISNNVKGDGISVGMLNVANGALLLQGPKAASGPGGTTVGNNGGKGIAATLTNVNLVNNFGALPAVSNLTVVGLTATDNNSTDKSVPVPVTLPISILSSVPSTGLGINNFNVTSSGFGGILFDGTNTTIADGGSISSNTIVGSMNGDGLRFSLVDQPGSNANAFLFNNNSSTKNVGGDGINVQLTNVSMNNSQFQNLTGSGNQNSTGTGNPGTGINLSLTGSTMNNLDLTGAINASNNTTADGLDITLQSSSLTPSKGPTSVTASNNGGNGVDISSLVNSQIFLDAKSLTANGNTGAGFVGTATLKSTLNISLDNPSFLTGNKQQGLLLNVMDAGTSSLFNVNTLTDNGNVLQGLSAQVSGGASLDYRSVNSTYNGNGYDSGGVANGSAGVQMQAGGAGTNLVTLFSGGSANGNGGAGFVFAPIGADMSGVATISASLNNGAGATGNLKDSLDFLAAKATNATLLVGNLGAASTFSGPMNLLFGGAGSKTAIAELTGTFKLNNGASNGMKAEFDGSNTAIFSLIGGGKSTADGNAAGGINILMKNTVDGSVLVSGFSSASNNNGGDGISASLSNMTAAALQLQGVANGSGTLLTGNSRNGLDTQLNKVNLVNNISTVFPAITVNVLTTGNNQLPPYGVLPAVAPLTLNLTGQVPTTALTVNNFNAASSGLGGIIVDAMNNTTIANNGGSISGNTASGSANGDGIQFQWSNTTTTTSTGFQFNNNTSTGNLAGDGINVGLSNVNLNNAQFQNLTGGGSTNPVLNVPASGNGGTGINLSLLNSQMNNVDMTGAWTANFNANGGVAITLNGSTMTPTTGPDTLTASGNTGGNGITITETNASNINIDIGTVTANNNTAGAGFNAVAQSGSSLNVCFDSGSLSNNGMQGLNILVSGPGSNGSVNLGSGPNTMSVNGNVMQGLLSQVDTTGTLYYSSVGTTYDNNGQGATKYDGVDMRADGVGTTLLTLFDGGSAGSLANGANGRDGFHFGGLTDGASMNGAYLTVSLSGVSATTNANPPPNGYRYALNFDASGAGAANLLLDPNNASTFNGLTNVNVSSVSSSVTELTGNFHFDNSAGDGLSANFTGDTSVVFFLNGLGTSTANGNHGDGININMTNVQNASVLIEGFQSISNNNGDGIHIGMTSNLPNPTITAIELLGGNGGAVTTTTMDHNGGNGILLSGVQPNTAMTNVSMVNNFATVATAAQVQYLTLPAAPDCLPVFNQNSSSLQGFVPNTGLTVNNFTVTNSTLGGIIVDGMNTTVQSGGTPQTSGSISNNVVSGSLGGDGIQLSFNNTTQVSTADGFQLNGNTSTGNSGDGIDISLVNATMNNLSMAYAVGKSMNVSGNGTDGLHFDLNNSSVTPTTGPTTLLASGNMNDGLFIKETNKSTLLLNVGTLTANTNKVSGVSGSVLSGSTLNLTAGAGSVSSNKTQQGINLLVDGLGSTANVNVSNLSVNQNFDQGLFAVASNGATLNYSSTKSTYNNNGTTTGSDGVDIQVDGAKSTLLALFSGDQASNNGNNAFHITGLNNAVTTNGASVTVGLSGVTVAQTLTPGATPDSVNMTVENSSNAYLLVDQKAGPTSLTGPANLDFSNIKGTAFASMTGTFVFNDGASNGLTANFANDANSILYVSAQGASTASNNAKGGINVTMTNTNPGFASLAITGFTDISKNLSGDGIGVNMSNVAQGALSLEGVGAGAGTTVNQNNGNGINVQLSSVNLINGYVPTVTSPTGLTITTPYSPSTAFGVDHFNVTNSTKGGIIVDGTSTLIALNGGSISNDTVTGSKNGDGIQLILQNPGPTQPVTADGFAMASDNSTFNTGNGINIGLTYATMNNLTLSGTASNNTLDGLLINLTSSSMNTSLGTLVANTNGTLGSAVAGNGVEINATTAAGSLINSSFFMDFSSLNAGTSTAGSGNINAGLLANATGGSSLNVCIDSGSLSNNGTQGLNIVVDGINAVDGKTFSNSAFNLGPVGLVGAGVSVNNNVNQGLLAKVTNGAELDYRSINSTYNANGLGLATNNDGVDMQVSGPGIGTNPGSTIHALFYGNVANPGSANGNGGAGYSFTGIGASGVNGGTLTVSLSGVTSTGNTGNALTFDGTNAYDANLLMDPTNVSTFTGPSSLVVAGVTNEVVLQTVGLSFNNLQLKFNQPNTSAFVSLDGNGVGTITNGAFITMTGLTNGSVFINNYKSITGPAVAPAGLTTDAVYVNIDGSTSSAKSTNAAIEINGVAALGTGPGGSGVNIMLNDTNLINNLATSASLPVVNGLSTGASYNTCLPSVVQLNLTNLNVIPANALTLSNLDVMGNTGTNGISVAGMNSSIQANGGFITGNTVGGTLSGDAISVIMQDPAGLSSPMINGLQVTTNIINGGGKANGVGATIGGDGIRVDVYNSGGVALAVDNVNISTNNVTGVGGSGIEFIVSNPTKTPPPVGTVSNLQINGDTVTNSGVNGLSLYLGYADLTKVAPSLNSDTFSSNGNNGIAMTLIGTNVTGLTTNSDIIDTNGNNGLYMSLNASTMTNWTASAVNGGVATDISGNGTSVAGNGVYITSAAASSVTGAAFTNVTIKNNGADGVNMMQIADGSAATFGSVGPAASPITFSGATISDNGQKAIGNGINLNTLVNGSVANLIFQNNTTVNNTLPGTTQQNGLVYTAGDGTTFGQVILSVTGGSFSNNAVDGINGTMIGTAAAGAPLNTVTLTGTAINGNTGIITGGGSTLTGGIGALFNVTNAPLNLTIQQDSAGTATTVSSNGGDGLQINATGAKTSVVSLIQNSQIKDNGTQNVPNYGNGITGMFDNGAKGTFTINDDTIGNTLAGGTQLDGVHLALNTIVPLGASAGTTDVTATITTTNLTTNSAQLTNNSASAVYVNAVGNASAVPTNGAHINLLGVTATGSGGMGVSLNASQGGLINFLAQNSGATLTTISNSALNGIYVNETDANTLVGVQLLDTTVNNNGTVFFPGDGVNATVLAGATLDLEATTKGFGPASFSGNSGNGINVFASGASSRIDIALDTAIVGSDATNGFSGNVLNGLKFQSYDGADVNVQANKTTFDTNGGAGMYGTVYDTLGLNDTYGIVRIVGGEANNNTGNALLGGGFNFSANNTSGSSATTATMTAYFQEDDKQLGVQATGNTGYGISFQATNPNPPYGGVVGNLLMTGNNTLSGNTAGSVYVNMNGAQNAVIGVSGTFDNNAGDGIDVTLNNILGLGLVSVQGGNTGEVFNNGGNGINVMMSNVNYGGVYVGAFTRISNNGTAHVSGAEDGIQVTMNNVGATTNGGALTIDGTLPGGTMNVSNNAGNGVNVNITGGSIIDNTNFISAINTIANLKVASNPVIILNSKLDQTVPPPPPPPLPLVPQDPSTLPMLFTKASSVTTILNANFTNQTAIQNLILADNGNFDAGATPTNGITFSADGSTTSIVGTLSINNNMITNTGVGSAVSSTHNGIGVYFTNTPTVSTVTFDTNTISGSTNDGIQVINPSTAGALTLNFTGNTISSNGTTTANTGAGSGIDVLLNSLVSKSENVTVNVDGSTAVNTISNNKSFGLHLDARQSSIFALNVTSTGGSQQIFNGNSDAGIGIEAGGSTATTFSTGTVSISNVLVENTTQNFHNIGNYPFQGDGLGVQTTGYAVITSFVVGDSSLRNTVFQNNGAINAAYGGTGPAAGDGINIHAIDNSKFQPLVAPTATIMVQNTNVISNQGDGINLFRTDNALMSIDSPTTPGGVTNVIDNNESFVHMNNIHATGNQRAGLNVFTTGGVLPVTRVDVADTTTPFNPAVPGSVFTGNGIGLKFVSQADGVLVANVTDTVASNSVKNATAGAGAGDGIYVETDQRATFGDMLQPVSGSYTVFQNIAVASTFNGLTASNNAANGLEIVSNDASAQKITVTNSTNTARNTFDNNLGDDVKMTNSGAYFQGGDSQANLFLDHVDMLKSNSAITTGDGLHVITTNSATAKVTLMDATIGAPRPANSTTQGLNGNGIELVTTGNSSLNALIGDQSIPLATADPANAPDVSIYGNALNGILIKNSGSSTFTDTVYDVASRFNAVRGYSALMAGVGNTDQDNIDHSLFDHNTREGIGFVTNTGFHHQIADPFFNGPNADIPISSWGTSTTFLRLNTDLSAGLTLTNSTITNNGTFPNPYSSTTPVVNGLLIDVSTNSKVNADIRSNTFGGNKADDMRTQAHIQTDGGFDANGNPTGNQINTNASVNAGANAFDTIYQNETAQMDMRFMFNKGDHIFISASAQESDTGGGKPGPAGNSGPVETALFSVDTFHYDRTAAAGASTTGFSGTTPLALDAAAGTMVDPISGLTVQRGIVNNLLAETNPTIAGQTPTPTTPFHTNGFYTNSDPNAHTFVPPVVRVDFRSGNDSGQTASISSYNPTTSAFTLNAANPLTNAPTANSMFRIHLLDTNTFDEPANPKQNIEGAFGAFQNNNTGNISSGGTGSPTTLFTPLDSYFTFPDTPFLP